MSPTGTNRTNKETNDKGLTQSTCKVTKNGLYLGDVVKSLMKTEKKKQTNII